MARALIVEDDRSSLQALAQVVENEGFEARVAENLEKARAELAAGEAFDLLLVDLLLPDGVGLELLRELPRGTGPDFVVITGEATVDSAVEALRGGAYDYLTKPVEVSRLRGILKSIARTAGLRGEVQALRGELRQLGRFGKIVGVSPRMQQVYDLIAKVAPTEASVLITGETGTGKELVAETLHRLSARARGPFVPLNCGAVPASLIESELFGHEAGSFTGASRMHRGLFERAEGGTLFLDEVTEMPAELQVRLLRVLESRTVQRVGGEKQLPVDVRVVTATNRDLDGAVREGRLREDLKYRLLVFPIHLPPLRERPGDVRLLAEHFLARLNRQADPPRHLTPEAVVRLEKHSWPGNVRELMNAIERAFILGTESIGPEALPLPAVGEPQGGAPARAPVGLTLHEAERRLILATLESLGGQKHEAARALGISLKTLYNRLKEYRSE